MNFLGVKTLGHVVNQRFARWLDRRMPAVDAVVLDHKNIFIFPSKAGWFFFVIGLLILVGAANYQNNLGLALAFWLGSLALVGLFLSFRNVLGVRLRAGTPTPVFVGELLSFPVWLDDAQGRAHQTLCLGTSVADLKAFDVPSQSTVLQAVVTEATQRGWQNMPRFLLQSNAPFGWMRVWSWPKLYERGLVYPSPLKPPDLHLFQGSTDGKSKRHIEGVEDFSGHRRWRTGDSLRQVDWKVYAKERGLMLREFSTPASDEWWFRLSDLPKASLETQLSWLTYLVLESERQGQRYGLDTGIDKYAPAQGDLHLHRCLKSLALFGLREE